MPEGCCADPIVHQGEEGLLDQQLGVEDDQLGRCWNEIIALVVMEKLGNYLSLVLSCKLNKHR